ncbi:KipI antagonist [Clostridium sp. C105KSO13]|nr:KipI antagonist [Clostridium sp. C105KSO13]
MGILVENPGVQTTVQDMGRFTYQQFGVSPAGPMDTKSFQIANILVGNKRTEGALEITYAGPSLRFEKDDLIAITGGDLCPAVNGKKSPPIKRYLYMREMCFHLEQVLKMDAVVIWLLPEVWIYLSC